MRFTSIVAVLAAVIMTSMSGINTVDAALSCHANRIEGTCISTGQCGSGFTSVPGRCRFNPEAHIQCCIRNPTMDSARSAAANPQRARPCTIGAIGGTCVSTSECQGRSSHSAHRWVHAAGHCLHDSGRDIQCCIQTRNASSGEGARSATAGTTCFNGNRRGQCMQVGQCPSNRVQTPGLCMNHGRGIQCCHQRNVVVPFTGASGHPSSQLRTNSNGQRCTSRGQSGTCAFRSSCLSSARLPLTVSNSICTHKCCVARSSVPITSASDHPSSNFTPRSPGSGTACRANGTQGTCQFPATCRNRGQVPMTVPNRICHQKCCITVALTGASDHPSSNFTPSRGSPQSGTPCRGNGSHGTCQFNATCRNRGMIPVSVPNRICHQKCCISPPRGPR